MKLVVSLSLVVVCGGIVTTVDCSEAGLFSKGHGVVDSAGDDEIVLTVVGASGAEAVRRDVKVVGASGATPNGDITPPECCVASVAGDGSDEVHDSGPVGVTVDASEEVIYTV